MLMTHTVWEFVVHVDVEVDSVKHAFTANTAMGWPEFLEKASAHFKNRQDGADIRLGYRFGGSGELRRFSQLECAYDWNLVVKRMGEKAKAAKYRAATLEIKNMVSDALLT